MLRGHAGHRIVTLLSCAKQTLVDRDGVNSLTKAPNELDLTGAYGVRYLFVIGGFSIAETENLRNQFSWDEPLKWSVWNLFDIGQ